MTAVEYSYTPAVQTEVEDMLRGALGPAVSFVRRSTLEDDYHGVDLYYVTSHEVPIQVRMRYDRPDYAPDDDITFRTTEPRMIQERTYAPLMAFGWLNGGRLTAGKLVDVYRMAVALQRSLEERESQRNTDGRTAFVTVSIEELFLSRALLRVGDRAGWANVLADSEKRLRTILTNYERSAA